MKIDQNFKLRKVAGETIIVNQGSSHTDLTNIIAFNATSELMWNEMYGKDFTVDDVTKLLVDTYEIDQKQAAKDAAYWVDKLKECKLIID